MARKSKGGGGGGAPEWLVTFADLMSLLVCFFVLIISFSNQDEKKLMIVAGSMREAFGSQTEIRRSGMIEVNGLPVNEYFKQSSPTAMKEDANHAAIESNDRAKQGPEANTHDLQTADSENQNKYLTAAASLRQALQDMPDIAEVSKSIVIHEDENGLNIELMDQDGRAMFASSSRFPYPVAREILARIAPVIRQMPNRVRISGHTSAGMAQSDPAYSHWELSADRAEVARQILVDEGLAEERFESVVGRADTDPLFVNDPFLAANRRVTILLIDEPPPLPANAKP